MDLLKLRDHINKIDAKLLSLLAERQSLVLAIGKYKKKNNLPINQPKREDEVLLNLEAIAIKNKISPILARKIYKEIFKYSKEIQKASR